MKKILIPLLAAGLLIGSGIAGAAVYHIMDAKEAAKMKVDGDYEEYIQERERLIKADTSQITDEEIKRLENEVMSYFNQKKTEDYQQHLNNYHQLIKEETNKSIQELKAYIDSLFE